MTPSRHLIPVGFIGLGNMGSALASNLVETGHAVIGFDVAGTAKLAPQGVGCASTISEVASTPTIVLSLPDGDVLEEVVGQILAAPDRHATCIIDTSTVGPTAARTAHARLSECGAAYVDAPVSGGVAGARNRTISVMCACADGPFAEASDVLYGLSDNVYRVGSQAGMGQAMKLANNFLSATALAATSEAIAFGLAAGLSMTTMLEVLNASSGRNSATADKFPNHVANGRYASGFTNTLMAKDVRLYKAEAARVNSPVALGAITADTWELFARSEPNVDFTKIYPYVEAGRLE